MTKKTKNQVVTSVPALVKDEANQCRHVLYADDEPLMRKNVAQALGRAGYDVTVVGDGEQAWQKLTAEHFDLLITDVEMPGLTGEELVARVRHEGLELPVIVAAARIEFFARAENKPLHVTALLQKPFLLRDLVIAAGSATCTGTFDPLAVTGTKHKR